MKRECRQPTKAEVERITIRRPVVRHLRTEEFRRFVESIVDADGSHANEKKEEVAPRAKRRC